MQFHHFPKIAVSTEGQSRKWSSRCQAAQAVLEYVDGTPRDRISIQPRVMNNSTPRGKGL